MDICAAKDSMGFRTSNGTFQNRSIKFTRGTHPEISEFYGRYYGCLKKMLPKRR